MANLQLIKTLAEKQKMPITELAERAGISEQQIHLMVRTNSTKITTLEKIASILEVPVTVFFDETGAGVKVTAIDHSHAAGRDLLIGTSEKESKLEKENQELRQQLIDAQSKIIQLMENQTK